MAWDVEMAVREDIARYAAAAQRHGEATVAGDAEAANEAYRNLYRCWQRIRSSSGEWPVSFLHLLEDEAPWVRLWAASHALHIDPIRSVAVLEALTVEPGFLGFNAQMTLETWTKGELGERN